MTSNAIISSFLQLFVPIFTTRRAGNIGQYFSSTNMCVETVAQTGEYWSSPVLGVQRSSRRYRSIIKSRFRSQLRHIVNGRVTTRTSFDIKGKTRCAVSKGANGNNNDEARPRLIDSRRLGKTIGFIRVETVRQTRVNYNSAYTGHGRNGIRRYRWSSTEKFVV